MAKNSIDKSLTFDDIYMNIYQEILEKQSAYKNTDIDNRKDFNIELLTDIEYSEKFKCSIAPVKKAMDELRKKGLIIRSAGKKTSINTESISPTLSIHDISLSLSKNAESKKYKVTNILISFGKIMNKEINNIKHPELLVNLPDATIYKLKRLRLFDDNPRVIQTAFFCDFAFTLNDQAIDNTNFNKNFSLMEFYKKNGYQIINREVVLQAVLPTQEQAVLLGIPQSVPLLKGYQVSYARHKSNKEVYQIEYLESLYKEWRYHFFR